MPDILIYRMKMPENKPLRLVLNPNGQLFVDHGVTFAEYEAVELPEHGDLIDRDALPKERVEWEDIVNAPVVIPSNKEDAE